MLMGWIGLLFLFLVLIGTPVFFSFGFSAVVACLGGGLPVEVVAQRLMIGLDSFALLAIPGFVLAGEIMCQGGISMRLVELSNALVGHLRGGLSMVAVLTGMIMGGISGSAVADTAAVASVLVPEMEKEKYPRDFSAAVVGTAGPLGNIIPPSIPMVVYSMISGLSLVKLFLAGYIPGVMIGVSLMIFCYVMARKNTYGGVGHGFSFVRLVKAFRRSILAVMTPIVIVGGILSGVFTPTESAMVGVVYSLIVAVLVYKELPARNIAGIFLRSAKTSAKLVIVIGIASVFSYISIAQGLPRLFQELIGGYSENKFVFLLILNAFLLILGCLIDILVATVVLVPVLIPVAEIVGINQLHLAVIFIVNMSIGLLTPPVGYSLYVSASVANVPVEAVARKSVPVVCTMTVVLALINAIPEISLWIPGLAE
jgi:tripartite ATP-independent transporter DctM subunit